MKNKRWQTSPAIVIVTVHMKEKNRCHFNPNFMPHNVGQFSLFQRKNKGVSVGYADTSPLTGRSQKWKNWFQVLTHNCNCQKIREPFKESILNCPNLLLILSFRKPIENLELVVILKSSSFFDFENFQKPETGGYRKIKELSYTGKNKIKSDWAIYLSYPWSLPNWGSGPRFGWNWGRNEQSGWKQYTGGNRRPS